MKSSDVSPAKGPPGLVFMRDGGEMGALMRAHDWAQTSIGTPEAWPQPLRTAIRLILNTRHPMYVWWGPDLLCFYNDAYSASIGPERHPGSLGQPGREVWEEIWPIIGPQVDNVIAGGGATWSENTLIPITRGGCRANVYWTYSYSPIDDDTSAKGVGGVLVVCTETTATVTAEHRQAFRVRLDDALRVLTEPDVIMATTAELLGRHLEVGQCGYAEIDLAESTATIERDWTNGTMTSAVGRRRVADFGAAFVADYGAGRAVRIDDALSDPRINSTEVAANTAVGGMRAHVTVPVIKGGVFVAALFVHQIEPRCWTDDEESLIREVAELTWAFVERVRAERSLRELNETLEARVARAITERNRAWNNARDLLLVVGTDGVIRAVNPAWAAILGWAEKDLVGSVLLAFAH